MSGNMNYDNQPAGMQLEISYLLKMVVGFVLIVQEDNDHPRFLPAGLDFRPSLYIEGGQLVLDELRLPRFGRPKCNEVVRLFDCVV